MPPWSYTSWFPNLLFSQRKGQGWRLREKDGRKYAVLTSGWVVGTCARFFVSTIIATVSTTLLSVETKHGVAAVVVSSSGPVGYVRVVTS